MDKSVNPAEPIIRREILRLEKNQFLFWLFVSVIAYIVATVLRNLLRGHLPKWASLIVALLQIFLQINIFFVPYLRLSTLGYRRWTWLFVVLAFLCRVDSWEIVIIPLTVLTMVILSERTQKISELHQHLYDESLGKVGK